jgi:hypothetical protein
MYAKNKVKNSLHELKQRNRSKTKLNKSIEEHSFNDIDDVSNLLFEISIREKSRFMKTIYDDYKIKEEIRKDRDKLRSKGLFIF